MTAYDRGLPPVKLSDLFDMLDEIRDSLHRFEKETRITLMKQAEMLRSLLPDEAE